MCSLFFLRLALATCLAAGSGAAFMADAGVLPKDSAEQYELTFWDSIRNSQQVADYQAYLQAYPKGRFAGLARTRIERLRSTASQAPAAPASGADTPSLRMSPAPGAGTGADDAPAAKGTDAPAAAARSESGRSGGGSSGQKSGGRHARQPPKSPDYTPGLGALAPSEAPADTPGQPPPKLSELRDCDACPQLVALPPGGFTMGSNSDDPSERPAFRVTIDKGFAIGKYETRVAEWNACIAAGACQKVSDDAARPPESPVRDVSWDDAQAYLKWLASLTGKTYRLPTEAEWEYAARGGTRSRFWWGELMTTGKANCRDCGPPWSADAPAKSGSFAANPFGLYDMNGSVWEWVSDCWHASYQRAPSDGRSWEEPDCRVRVLRGGSWRDGGSYMPSSTRFKYDASVRQSQNGFRVVREMP